MVHPTCFFADDRLWLGTWNNVNLMVWRNSVLPHHLDKLRDYYVQLAKTTPRWHSLSIMSGDNLPKIGPSERERIRELVALSAPHLISSAQVVEGKGLWAAAVRALMLGINGLSRAPSSVFGNAESACEWMAKRERADPYGLCDAVLDVRRHWLNDSAA